VGTHAFQRAFKLIPPPQPGPCLRLPRFSFCCLSVVAHWVIPRCDHCNCRGSVVVLNPVRYVQAALRDTMMGPLFWLNLRKQWETHLNLFANRQQPYMPPAAYGAGPGFAYFSAPPGVPLGAAMGSPVGKTNLAVAPPLDSVGTKRRLTVGE
jgi:hypothetical protein